MANGEQDWEKSLPPIVLAYNSSIHRVFSGKEKLNYPTYHCYQHSEPCGLEEDIDQVWEDMRVVDEVEIHRQFRSYSGRQEDLQVWDYVCAVVLLQITNSRKLAFKWSGPLIINRFMINTIIIIKEIFVRKPREFTWLTILSSGWQSAMA